MLRYLTASVSLGPPAAPPYPYLNPRDCSAREIGNPLPLGQLPLAHSTEYELSQTVKTGNI